MAKAKQQELSIEEKLEQALVPEDEQPYEVPSNWVWTRFSITVDYEQPTDYIVESTEYRNDFDTPVLTAGKSFILGYTDENFGVFRNLPVIIFDDFTTDTKYVDFPFKVKSSAMKVLHTRTDIDLKFIYYYMQAVDCDHSEHRRYWISTYSQLPFPLPPLAEQQRIVDRIESLFEKLDNAKELAQNALDSFETRKAAILHKAFTGELTAQWREKNGVGMDSWEESNLGFFVDTKYGYTESAYMDEVGPKFLRITDIQDNDVEWSTVPFCPILDSDYKKYALNVGDIVVARTGATTGKSYLIRDDVKAVYASYLIRISILKKERLSERYLYHFMQSSLYWSQITEFSQGIAQPGVNANRLKDLVITVPTLCEQMEVVRILDSLFEKEKKAKELCDVIDKIDLMKKAVLARAFRGELGTNDLNEESAVELLKDCLK